MVLTAGGHTFVSISSGFRHTLALKSTGELYSWGVGTYNGVGSTQTSPSKFTLFSSNVLKMSAGYQHNIVLLKNNDIYVFGTGTVRQHFC
jgi:alpha-tubulin suppressor-like RCC1 family protein